MKKTYHIILQLTSALALWRLSTAYGNMSLATESPYLPVLESLKSKMRCKEPLKILSLFEIGCTSTVRNAKDSPLLRLPAEIRNLIYHHLLDTAYYRLCMIGWDTKLKPPAGQRLLLHSRRENGFSLLPRSWLPALQSRDFFVSFL